MPHSPFAFSKCSIWNFHGPLSLSINNLSSIVNPTTLFISQNSFLVTLLAHNLLIHMSLFRTESLAGGTTPSQQCQITDFTTVSVCTWRCVSLLVEKWTNKRWIHRSRLLCYWIKYKIEQLRITEWIYFSWKVSALHTRAFWVSLTKCYRESHSS